MRKHNAMLIGLCLCLVRSPCAWANYLSNGSFETGHPGGWTNAVGWYSTEEWGGELIADADAFHGTNSIKINAFGTSSHILNQRWPLTGGQVYEVSGYMRTSTTNAFNPTNGYCTIVVQFYDRTGNKVARNCDTLHFVGNGPTSWTRYSTGPLLAPANAVTGRTILFYYRGVPPDETTNGEVFVDYVVATDSSPSQAGAVLNPDFEVQPVGNALTNIPYWTAFGNAGAVVEEQAHTGRFALMLWWTETLLGQSWDATSGMRYGTSAWVMTPTNDPMTGTNSHAVVLLQYLNSTGGVIVTYESDWVGPTNVSGGTWSNLVAEGIAPTGTVSGRTMLAILGQDDSFGGVVYFDDVSQYTLGGGTTTVCGVLENSGFEDGIKGNAYDLDASGQLPAWEWLGGTNAGFITDALDLGGWQSLAITYPENLAAQVFAPATGMQYVLSGYIYNPSTTAEVLRGEAYGTFVLEFRNGTDLVSSVTTEHFDTNSAHDTWVFFAVTNRAPWGDPGQGLTGRVLSAILGSGTNYGGALYFDQLCLTGSAAVVTNLQSGALWNPGFEYTARGTVLKYVDDWEALGLAGVVDGEVRRSGEHSLEIYYPETLAAQYWEAQPGYKYESAAWVYTPDGEGRLEGVSNLHAVVLLQYLDSTGGVLYTYESGWFTTNDAAGVWTQLVVRGVAPVGTVTGRTLVGLLGTNTGFGGAVYFDDAGQALVSTGGSVSG
ncbi:MAG TPA: hypothetical protein EYP62_01490, partial [Kiritimatiellae bacterium]|nr:hypothetical protein [Kiritimatiellia bacterium]